MSESIERKMVKCTVCGEVFDASIQVCPVCGAGPDKFVEVKPEGAHYRYDTKRRFLILGGGPAAHYAAEAIRERDNSAYITILTNEAYIPYNRPMLTKALLDEFTGESFAITSREWYAERNINIAHGQEILSIDTAAKEVRCQGAVFSYDQLIYALGARCFVPPFKGVESPHVFSVRNLADVEKVQACAKDVKDVVVIGGGVMGLEAAWELKCGGMNVTVVEGGSGLLGKQLDSTGSEMLLKIVRSVGIEVATGGKTEEITADSVVLADGRVLPAQMVIVSTGMRPNIAIAEEAGIETDRLIKVDKYMGTSARSVFACGDCVEFNGQQQAFWAQAKETGRVAGANAAGEPVEYDALGSILVINAFNTSIFALGTNGKDPDRTFTSEEKLDEEAMTYEKYYYEDGRLVGTIIIGDTSGMVDIADKMKEA